MSPSIVLISFPFHIIIISLLSYNIIWVVNIGRFVRFGWFVIIGYIGIGDTLFLLIYCVDICCFIFLFINFVILYLYCKCLIRYFSTFSVSKVHCVHICINVITGIYFWAYLLLFCLFIFIYICTTMWYSIFNPISCILVRYNLKRFSV